MSEYVLSNELVSMALAMVAESHFVNSILAELFTVGGSELYSHPAARYLQCALTPETMSHLCQADRTSDANTGPANCLANHFLLAGPMLPLPSLPGCLPRM